MRVLDIDLDFFVHGVAYYKASRGPRLSDEDYRAWSLEEVLRFLEDRCLLSNKLPGWVVEHHAEVFPLWRAAVRSGWLETPFHVTHVDAHADLGLGDAGYVRLITEVMYRRVEDRDAPEAVEPGIGDGNWLAYAVACRCA